MDTVMKPGQNGRGRRRQWSSEQKLTVLQEWQTGVTVEEICRKYAVNTAQMYRWKRSLYGPEHTSHRFWPFVRAMGLIPCHTPRRSPESNGLAEAFFGSFKRGDVYQACWSGYSSGNEDRGAQVREDASSL